MSEDIQKGPFPPRRGKHFRAGEEEPDLAFALPPPYPWTVIAAGVLWINFGGLVLAHVAAVVLMNAFLAQQTMSADSAKVATCITGFVAALVGLFGAVCTYMGVQCIRGTIRGTRLEGIVSIVACIPFAAWALATGCAYWTTAHGLNALQAGINLLEAVGLLTAGGLALAGSSALRD